MNVNVNKAGNKNGKHRSSATAASSSTATTTIKNTTKKAHNKDNKDSDLPKNISSNNNTINNNKLMEPTTYDNVLLHDISGNLTLTPEKLIFRPEDKHDKEHYYGWSWESLQKHVISAPPVNVHTTSNTSNTSNKNSRTSSSSSSGSSSTNSNPTNTANTTNTTPTNTNTPTNHPFDDCFLKLVSYADPHKTVAFQMPSRKDLNNIHQDISHRMYALRKYRKAKEALLETKAKYKQATRSMDQLQDQNQKLLVSFETAAKKATYLHQLHDQLKNEKTAMEIEHEMDQQEWKQQQSKLQQELKEVRKELKELKRRHKPLKELELEIHLLAKELLQEKAKNDSLTKQLWMQENEYEALLWQVRKQRNNVMLELRHTQKEREALWKMKAPEITTTTTTTTTTTSTSKMDEEKDAKKPLAVYKYNQKVSLSQSVLYGNLIKALFDPSRNDNDYNPTADLSRYYEHIFQVADASQSGLLLLKKDIETVLNLGNTAITSPLVVARECVEPFHNPEATLTNTTNTNTATTTTSSSTSTADNDSSYSILGYCTVDCRVVGHKKESDMQLQWVSNEQGAEKMPRTKSLHLHSPPSSRYNNGEAVVECLPDNNNTLVLGESYNNTNNTNIDFHIRDICRYDRYNDTDLAWKRRYCNPVSALEDTVAVWMKEANTRSVL